MYGNWIKILDLNKVKKEKKIKENSTWRMSKSKETKPQLKIKKNLAEKRHWKKKTYLKNHRKANKLKN